MDEERIDTEIVGTESGYRPGTSNIETNSTIKIHEYGIDNHLTT